MAVRLFMRNLFPGIPENPFKCPLFSRFPGRRNFPRNDKACMHLLLLSLVLLFLVLCNLTIEKSPKRHFFCDNPTGNECSTFYTLKSKFSFNQKTRHHQLLSKVQDGNMMYKYYFKVARDVGSNIPLSAAGPITRMSCRRRRRGCFLC
jgi:hypothetical protein